MVIGIGFAELRPAEIAEVGATGAMYVITAVGFFCSSLTARTSICVYLRPTFEKVLRPSAHPEAFELFFYHIATLVLFSLYRPQIGIFELFLYRALADCKGWDSAMSLNIVCTTDIHIWDNVKVAYPDQCRREPCGISDEGKRPWVASDSIKCFSANCRNLCTKSSEMMVRSLDGGTASMGRKR